MIELENKEITIKMDIKQTFLISWSASFWRDEGWRICVGILERMLPTQLGQNCSICQTRLHTIETIGIYSQEESGYTSLEQRYHSYLRGLHYRCHLRDHLHRHWTLRARLHH